MLGRHHNMLTTSLYKFAYRVSYIFLPSEEAQEYPRRLRSKLIEPMNEQEATRERSGQISSPFTFRFPLVTFRNLFEHVPKPELGNLPPTWRKNQHTI